MIINVHRSSCTVPVILHRFQGNLYFLTRFSKIAKIYFMKIRAVGVEFFRANRQTDRQTDSHEKSNSHFSQNLWTDLKMVFNHRSPSIPEIAILPTYWFVQSLLSIESVDKTPLNIPRNKHTNQQTNISCLSQYFTNLMHKICFTISIISCLYMFRAHVLIIRRSKLHYTASGIITLKQVSGLKLLQYNSINMHFSVDSTINVQ